MQDYKPGSVHAPVEDTTTPAGLKALVVFMFISVLSILGTLSFLAFRLDLLTFFGL